MPQCRLQLRQDIIQTPHFDDFEKKCID